MSVPSAADDRLVAWQRRTELPLLALAVVFLVVYAVPILDPRLPRTVIHECELVAWAVWGVFVVDYLARLMIATDRARFVRNNLLDLATVVLPVLRPLRVLRIVPALRVVDRRAALTLHGRVAVYIPTSVALVVFVAALAVVDAERHARASNIKTFGDGVWWAFTTITSVGYGDRFPITPEGRLVAVGLMLAGIALLGVVTATVAGWFIQHVAEVQQAEAATRAEVDLLLAEVRELRAELRATRGGVGSP
jgi:voltage-gated potassium channel